MYYLVNVDHKGMAVHLTRSHYDGLQEVLYIQYSEFAWYVVEW